MRNQLFLFDLRQSLLHFFNENKSLQKYVQFKFFGQFLYSLDGLVAFHNICLTSKVLHYQDTSMLCLISLSASHMMAQ